MKCPKCKGGKIDFVQPCWKPKHYTFYRCTECGVEGTREYFIAKCEVKGCNRPANRMVGCIIMCLYHIKFPFYKERAEFLARVKKVRGMEKMKKSCHTGSAYLCNGWTKEKNPFFRREQKYCFKCGKPIEFNCKTNRWRHVREK
jgi:hypothetical protein